MPRWTSFLNENSKKSQIFFIFLFIIVFWKCVKKYWQNSKQNLYCVHGSLVERQPPVRGCASSSPGKSIIFKLGSLFAENAPNYWKKSAKTLMCAYCQIDPKTLNMYSCHGSLVERPHPITGGAGPIPGKFIIYYTWALCVTRWKLKLAGHLEK